MILQRKPRSSETFVAKDPKEKELNVQEKTSVLSVAMESLTTYKSL
jgi:hypothetical protein